MPASVDHLWLGFVTCCTNACRWYCPGLMNRVFGHQQAIETLRAAINADRRHHAWIFSGPVGVGKCTLAMAYSQVLLDPEANPADLGQGATSSGQVSRLLEAGTHPDLHIVRRELAATSENPRLRERKQINIPVDLLRETILGGRTSDDRMHEAAAYRTPVLGREKVFIIDDAHRMDAPGQNLLLKTLEEPPSGTTFVLVTPAPERLLPTVRSRCQHVRLKPLSDEHLAQWLEASSLDMDDHTRQTALEFAQGAPGMVDLVVRRNLTSWFDQLAPLMRVLDDGGWPEDVGDRMATCIEDWSQRVIDENPKASKDAANREGAEMLMRILGDHLRGRIAAHVEDPHTCATVCRRVDHVATAEAQVHAGLNLKHVLEGMAARWSVA